MRYEHIEWNLSTRACDRLLDMINNDMRTPDDPELVNCRNELLARLQRTDVDPHCPLNESKDWI